MTDCAQLDLDIEQPAALLAYLRQTGRIGSRETPTVQRLSGGVSSRTLRVQRASGEAWVLKQALNKLRVGVDWFSDPGRIHNEATALRWLRRLAPPGAVPRLIFEDHAYHVLAMEAVSLAHVNWKTLLLAGGLELRHVQAFGELLATIHARSAEHLTELAVDFPDLSLFESLRLEPYYRYTAMQVPAAAEFYARLIAATLAQRTALVHGDYSPKNVLLCQDQLILLDPEVAHLGDPAFDVGFAAAHLLSKAHHLTNQRGALGTATEQFWAAYARTLGAVPGLADLEARAAQHTLGCLLARVAGRSPLEYLSAAERARQQAAVVALLPAPPQTLAALVRRFLTHL